MNLDNTTPNDFPALSKATKEKKRKHGKPTTAFAEAFTLALGEDEIKRIKRKAKRQD